MQDCLTVFVLHLLVVPLKKDTLVELLVNSVIVHTQTRGNVDFLEE